MHNILKSLSIIIISIILITSCAPPRSSVDHATYKTKHNTSTSNSKCAEVKKVKVNSREFIHAGEKYLDIKNRLIEQLLADAVTQTIGLEIRRHSRLTIETRNEIGAEGLKDGFKEISTDKAKGYIKSYRIEAESFGKVDDLPILELSLIVDVCIPKFHNLREIIIIGTFESKSSDLEGVKELVSSVFFDNDKYELVKGNPENTYHDWLITGKLLSATATCEKSFGRSILGAFAGMVEVNRKRLSVDPHVIKVTVISYMQAKNTIDNRIISNTLTLTKNFPVSLSKKAIENNIDILIMESFKEASVALFEKLIAGWNER